MAIDLATAWSCGWTGKLLRLPLRLLPKGLVLPILRGPLRGQWWIVGAATHGFWLGSYETSKLQLMASLLRPGDVVYDIGANAGIYTLLAGGRVGSAGRVYAFEPLPENVRSLRRHLELNGLSNVSVEECAVTDGSGVMRFDASRSRLQGRISAEGNLSVSTLSLDEFVWSRGNPLPQLIKMDVEGAEVKVLEGARRLLAEGRPLVLLATHFPAAHRECCQLLGSSRYTISSLDGSPAECSAELIARPSKPNE